MGKVKIRFHPLFVLYIFLCVYFGWMNEIFFYILTVVLHEGGHFYMAESLGYRTDGILFSIYGAGLKSNHSYKSRDDILISLAGPLVNVILIIVCVAMWWIFPTSYLFTLEFVRCNIIVLVFNILPIYPLDGSKVLNLILDKIFPYKLTHKISVIISFIVLIILIFVNYYNFNYTTILIISVIITNIVKYYQNINYLFNKFLLERYLYNFNFYKPKKITKIDNMYKEKLKNRF